MTVLSQTDCRQFPRCIGLFTFLALNMGLAAPIELTPQLIILPASASAPRFADVDGDGRSDLLVIDPEKKSLLIYRQRPAGFTNSPDQAILLPPQTAWVALCDVDAHPGLELLMSTATGLVYSRQNAGRFETEWRTLIEAAQVFTNNDLPILASLTTNKLGTNVLIPVISAGQTVLHQRNSAYEWSPGPPLALNARPAVWSGDRDSDSWAMGSINPSIHQSINVAHSLRVQQSFRAKTNQASAKTPENDTIRRLMEDMKTNGAAGPPRITRADVDGDGREDLVLWQIHAKLDIRTDIYLFLRGADQRLPEQPTQVLHGRGFPIPIGPLEEPSPASDLNGDGVCELVLLKPAFAFTSPGAVLEAALSRGLEWSLTIQSFDHGAFSRNPPAFVPVKAFIPVEDLDQWVVFLPGDFNGDGRPDLLIRRSETQWNIYFSTNDGRWFVPQPALTFNAPWPGYFEMKDLNGDGRADLIWHESDQPRLSIFLSPSPGASR